MNDAGSELAIPLCSTVSTILVASMVCFNPPATVEVILELRATDTLLVPFTILEGTPMASTYPLLTTPVANTESVIFSILVAYMSVPVA